MKRAVMLLAVGALILGVALPAMAQAPTVSFGGQMRIHGFVFDNVRDYADSTKDGKTRDSESFFFQRFRLYTNVESADKKAKAVWAVEIGDITWGAGGGASAGDYGCTGAAPIVNPTVTVAPTPPATTGPAATVTSGTPSAGTRVGPSSGGCLGNDGVNVETKNLYLWLNTSEWVPGSSLLLGIHGFAFLDGPIGAFAGDDGAGIQFNWKSDPVDLQVYGLKVTEGANANADDVDLYAVRLGIAATKDIRLTLEGLVVDQRSLAGQSFGDTFWIGGTVTTKMNDVSLHGSFIYGQRALAAAAGGSCTTPCEETGFGAYVSAQMPMAGGSVFVIGWYTSGDDTRGPGSNTTGPLSKNSDKLPLPIAGASWFGGGGPWIAETLFGNQTLGAPSGHQHLYADPTGTFGIGASATFPLSQALSAGGGVAYVGATDAPSAKFGDSALTVDGGVIYKFNANLTITGIVGYVIPDTGDNAWQAAFRTQFSF